MEPQSVYDQLNQTAPSGHERALLTDFLIESLNQHKQRPDDGEAIAYSIAGLGSTRYVQSLAEDDPIKQIIDVAGILELPEHQRDSAASWNTIERLLSESRTQQ